MQFFFTTTMITRTINPLHFEDLEPHRFEDLIRQLIYDFKDWKSIEATGRLGSDDGIDILAIENSFEEFEGEDETEYVSTEKTWIIQCKREKILSPKKVVDIVKSDINKQIEPPYGYILASSSNFSKKARDSFKITMNSLGVQEFYIYGKAEIEDLLFQPKYDHLLFAYFGISLQKRRRNIKTEVSSRLATKRKLIKTIGDFDNIRHKTVFVKPLQSFDYPNLNDKKPLWRYYETMLYQPVDCLSLITKKHLAYVNWETEEWDIIDTYDLAFSNYPEIRDYNYQTDSNQLNRYEAYQKWDSLDKKNKAFYSEIKPIHFDRIVVIDEIGDAYHEAPHLIVDFINDSPFENKSYSFIEDSNSNIPKVIQKPDDKKRINYFK